MVNSVLSRTCWAAGFETRDGSRNNWFVAILSFGEGWHNNHHAHPVSARHGLAWYEVDITWYMIHLLEKLGVAKAVKAKSLKAKAPLPERVRATEPQAA